MVTDTLTHSLTNMPHNDPAQYTVLGWVKIHFQKEVPYLEYKNSISRNKILYLEYKKSTWPSYSIVFALGSLSHLALVRLGLHSLGSRSPWPSGAWPLFVLVFGRLVFVLLGPPALGPDSQHPIGIRVASVIKLSVYLLISMSFTFF